jgi:ElaB/YqjD/DUF883 family membrane-anchored ribosome-binding protein
MQTEILKEAIEIGVKAALQNLKVERFKEAMDEAIDDGLAITRRAVKKSRRNAEEAIDAATNNVKKHPMLAVGVTLGVGVGIGAIIGLLASRNGRS